MKQKGFTLIELLAVIVILAIIALIAIPQITNVIEEARKGAAESSALGYIDAVEKYIMLHDVDSTKYPYDLRGKTLNVAKNTDISLLDIFVKRVYAESAIPSLNEIINPKGKKPTSGTIVVNEKGQVIDYLLKINGYKVTPKDNKTDDPKAIKIANYKVNYDANGGEGTMASTTNKVVANTFTRSEYKFVSWNTKSDGTGETYTTESDVESNLTLYAIWKEHIGATLDTSDIYSSANVKQLGVKGVVYMDPTNLKRECNASNSVSTTGIKTGCMKFYIYNDSGDTYKMILDHNTTSLVAYDASGNYKKYVQASIKMQVDSDTSGWINGLNPRLITADEIATITNTTTFDGSSSTNFYLDGTGNKKQTQVSTSQGQSPYAWLYDCTKGCTSYGCNIADSSTYGYWTSTPTSNNSNYAWVAHRDGGLYGIVVDSGRDYGVRPVIEVQKSVFE